MSKAKITKIAFLEAITLNPKTKRPIRTPKGKNVVYGLKKGKKIYPLPMQPQKFAVTDLRQLQTLINKNELVQPTGLVVFEKPTNQNEKYLKRTPVKIKVRNKKTGKEEIKTVYKKKGEQRYIYENYKPARKAKKLKVVFKAPTHRIVQKKKRPPKYKITGFDFSKGKFKQKTIDYRLQERTRLERIIDQTSAEFTPMTKEEREGAEGFKTQMVTMRGKTLNHTLNSMLPPSSYEELSKKGYKAIGATITGNIEGEKFGPLTLPAVPLNQYADLKNQMSKAIRGELLGQGKTFTKLKDFESIKEEIYKTEPENPYQKWKAVNTYMSSGQFRDIQTSINQKARGENPDVNDIKRGDLKLQVSYHYYKGL